MDPIQFRIDRDLLAEVLTTIIVLAFFIERALSIIVESKWFINTRLDDNGAKEIAPPGYGSPDRQCPRVKQ